MRIKKQNKFFEGLMINYYKCPECNFEWPEIYSCEADSDCSECTCRHISPYASASIPDPNYKPAWTTLIYIYEDVQHDVYLFDYNDSDNPTVRARFSEILVSAGFRPIKEKETVKQYWSRYLNGYQCPLIDEWTEELVEDLKKKGCNPDLFNGQDEFYKLEDSIEILG